MNHSTSSICNDRMRGAFDTIARKAIPHMDSGAYFSDLLWDARQMADMGEGEEMFILVRLMSTQKFATYSEAVEACHQTDGRVVLKVVCNRFDRFVVTVVYQTLDAIVREYQRAHADYQSKMFSHKSDAVERWAGQSGLNVVDVKMADVDPADLRGLPE